ncbi:MAG: lipoyl synthase [Chlamydiae bacterium]|nr:lipoyl synthase [Chlamydiota bacterium]
MNKLNVILDNKEEKRSSFPKWLHRRLPSGNEVFKTESILEKYKLNTVCEEAKCPNRTECYAKKTATFLALGKACTRACRFCDIDFSKTPLAPEKDEPIRIAKSAKELGLSHVVITMVARDDLEDQGSNHIKEIIKAVRQENPTSTIEVLTSDFNGNLEALDTVLNESPEIFNHNIETVKRLTPKIRHKATYEKTLFILSEAKKRAKNSLIKSGIMVGLGESEEEVYETMRDLKIAGCDIVTIGHYLQPSKRKATVQNFVDPETFLRFENYGKELGFLYTYSGPFVRSSYNAFEVHSKVTT